MAFHRRLPAAERSKHQTLILRSPLQTGVYKNEAPGVARGVSLSADKCKPAIDDGRKDQPGKTYAKK